MPEKEKAFSGERCGMTCAVELSARWPRLQAAVEAGGSLRVHGVVHRMGSRATPPDDVQRHKHNLSLRRRSRFLLPCLSGPFPFSLCAFPLAPSSPLLPLRGPSHRS